MILGQFFATDRGMSPMQVLVRTASGDAAFAMFVGPDVTYGGILTALAAVGVDITNAHLESSPVREGGDPEFARWCLILVGANCERRKPLKGYHAYERPPVAPNPAAVLDPHARMFR